MFWQPHRSRQTRPARIHLRLWLAYLLVVTVVIGIDSYGRYVFHRKLGAYRAAENTLEQKKTEILRPVYRLVPDGLAPQPARFEFRIPILREIKRLVMNHMPVRNRGVSKETVEKILNDGQPFITREGPVRLVDAYTNRPVRVEVASYRPPDGSITLDIYFRDGYFSDAERAAPILESPKPWPWWSAIERHASVVLRHALIAWILLLVVAIVFARFRWLAAELALMISITSLITHLPPPLNCYYTSKFKLHEQAPWDITMIALSLTLLSWIYFARRAGSRVRCPVCEYNLRGNSTGICPECGSKIPEGTRERLAFADASPAGRNGLRTEG